MKSEKNLIDFNKYFSCISYNAKNIWRQKIVSKMTICCNKSGEVIDTAYLNHACLAENVYSGKSMLAGNYTWQAIITNEYIKEVRIGCKLSLSDSKIKYRKDLNIVDIIENNCIYRELGEDGFYSIMENNEPLDILCEISYELEDDKYATILFPGNYINFNAKYKKYQFDVGPVLTIPKLKDRMIDSLEIAYCAFSNTHSQTEFNTLSKSMYLNQGRYMLAKK